MRPLRILRFIPDRFGGGQEIEIADGITRLALYAEHGRYAVSRLVGSEWKLVGERLSQAAVEAAECAGAGEVQAPRREACDAVPRLSLPLHA